ncbi:YbaB/EbfC family nucleoid-associated protein [Nonomuraea sp. NPDC049400]|uniref:YbaB/EbfC family nucleoid-associated protein n=1 Tax=Nonomuraea sp. NPDC049400 TaxID=3364352 RepID=UPI0037B2C5BA
MTPPGDPFNAAGDPELSRLLEGYRQDVAALERLSEEIGAVRGRGEAAEGRVVAEVTQTGALAGLTIDPRAMRLGSTELAAAILEAAAAAARDAERGADDVLGPFIAGTLFDEDDGREARGR